MTKGLDVAGVPECVDCGVCCFSTMTEYVRVFGVDHDRMDARALEHTVFVGNKCFMRMRDGRCTALVLDPADRTLKCSIYAMRPDVCRSLERGSGNCAADRHEKAARPGAAFAALITADRLVRGAGEPS